MALPPELVSQITGALDLQPDPLDALAGFDQVQVINALLPDESSISQAEAVQSKLRTHLRQLEDETRRLRVELAAEHDEQRVQVLQELIAELLAQVARIREKAAESEAIVREMTRDIKALDNAKTNLRTSMLALKRFQMLVNATTQLSHETASASYAPAAETLKAVRQLSAHFKPLARVERIAEVLGECQAVQARLREQVLGEFRAFVGGGPEKEGAERERRRVRDAAGVVDALGEDARTQVVDWYTSHLLRDYRRIFRPTDEAGQLDNLPRRFAWFRRVLKAHDDQQASAQVWPESWAVGQRLVVHFAGITRDDLRTVLERAAPTLTVSLLLESLSATVEFEREMGRKYGVSFPDLVRTLSSTPLAPSVANTTMSSSFEPHLHIFVQAQDKTLSEMVSTYRSARPSLDRTAAADGRGDGERGVLESSTELFYFYRQTLEQGAAISRGTMFRELVGVFGRWLRAYANDVLLASLSSSAPPSRRSADLIRRSAEEPRWNVAELRGACVVLNTADYCLSTSTQLEDKLKEKIAEEFREEVSLEAERDVFLSVASSTITRFLRELASACEPAFGAMLRTPWSNLGVNVVTGPSAYIRDLIHAVRDVAEVVKDGVEGRKYWRSFGDKAVGFVVARLTQCVVRSRPISTVGAEQILLDLQELRQCLMELPNGEGETTSPTSSYGRYINKTMGRLETILKVILTPADPQEAFVQSYASLVQDRSFANFQKILDLKGVKRADQNNLLDIFLAVTSSNPDLQDTSFLTSLDMDPPASAASALPQSLVSPILDSNPSGAFGPGGSGAGGTDTPPSGQAGARHNVFGDMRKFFSNAVSRKDSAFVGGGAGGRDGSAG